MNTLECPTLCATCTSYTQCQTCIDTDGLRCLPNCNCPPAYWNNYPSQTNC